MLLVEDDATLGAAIRFGLSPGNFVVHWVRERAAAETALASDSYAAVVLDLGLPGKQAFALLETLHWRIRATPVVIISAHDVPPERLHELAARIRGAIHWRTTRAEHGTTVALPFSWG